MMTSPSTIRSATYTFAPTYALLSASGSGDGMCVKDDEDEEDWDVTLNRYYAIIERGP